MKIISLARFIDMTRLKKNDRVKVISGTIKVKEKY
jgi:hypothetical protein